MINPREFETMRQRFEREEAAERIQIAVRDVIAALNAADDILMTVEIEPLVSELKGRIG